MNNNENKKKKGFKAWWFGLKTPIKVAICGVASLGVASAVVFPVLSVTVWNKKSEDTGTAIVTEEEWIAAFNLMKESETRNFTIKGDTSSTKNLEKSNFILKEQESHESFSLSSMIFTKKENTVYYSKKDGGNWEAAVSFQFDKTNGSSFFGISCIKVLGTSEYYKQSVIENNAYHIRKQDQGTSGDFNITFSKDKRISKYNCSVYSESDNYFTANFQFTDYGTTTISDFPQ